MIYNYYFNNFFKFNAKINYNILVILYNYYFIIDDKSLNMYIFYYNINIMFYILHVYLIIKSKNIMYYQKK